MVSFLTSTLLLLLQLEQSLILQVLLIGDNVTGTSGVATFDLALAVEGNNDVELEANLVLVTINGHMVPAAAIRFNTTTEFTITDAQLGYVIEPTDVIEYKYIKD